MEDHSIEVDGNEVNTTLLELQGAFAEALRGIGVMGKLRAQLRAAAVSVIRGDPHLRAAAVGEVVLPSAMSLEGRIALLLIEDFARAHSLRQTAGVFEAESNVSMVEERDRATLQLLSGAGKVSILESLIAEALERRGAAPPPPPSSSTSSLRTPHPSQRQEDVGDVFEGRHRVELGAALKDYENSVEFSDTSVSSSSRLEEFVYEHEENF